MSATPNKKRTYIFSKLPNWWFNTPIFGKHRTFFPIFRDVLIRVLAIPLVLISLVVIPFEGLFHFFYSKFKNQVPVEDLENKAVDKKRKPDDETFRYPHLRPLRFSKENSNNLTKEEEYSDLMSTAQRLTMAAQDEHVRERFGLYTVSDSLCFEGHRDENHKDLPSFRSDIKIFKRIDDPTSGFGHFFAGRETVDEKSKTTTIDIIDLRPDGADEKGLEESRNLFMHKLLSRYESGFTVNNNEIRDTGGKAIVKVNFFQDQKGLLDSQIMSADLMTQEPGTPFCGAIAAINAIRLSYDKKTANDILDDFSARIFEAFPNPKVLFLCHDLKVRSEAAIKSAQGFQAVRLPERLSLDDLNQLDVGKWWGSLPPDERYIMAMHVYLSGYKPYLAAWPKPV